MCVCVHDLTYVYLCEYVWKYVCMHACLNELCMHVRMYAFTYGWIYVLCMYVYIYADMHVPAYIGEFQFENISLSVMDMLGTWLYTSWCGCVFFCDLCISSEAIPYGNHIYCSGKSIQGKKKSFHYSSKLKEIRSI